MPAFLPDSKDKAPQPKNGELPTEFASRLGQFFTSRVSSTRRQSLGQFFTPVEVARFMASLIFNGTDPQRILDPGSGTGILAAAICELLPRRVDKSHLEAFEVDPDLAALCTASLNYAKDWLLKRGVRFTFKIHQADFVLETADSLTPRLFNAAPRLYDAVVANPPYFKLQKSDPRSVVAGAVNHGQPNIYAIFMALAASALIEGGVMVTITPRSFATGDYFAQCRRHVFSRVVPETVHLFDSRRATFREDAVLQENVILQARRTCATQEAVVHVSTSHGPGDIGQRAPRKVALPSVIEISSPEAIFHIPAREDDVSVMRFLRSWPNTLHTLGLEASTGPVVAFRARRFLFSEPRTNGAHAPLLWLHNVRQMAIDWPASKGSKAPYILDSAESRGILLPNETYVLLRRFTAKEEARRLTAAPLLSEILPGRVVGIENHLNYIHRPHGKMHADEAFGLAALLGSHLIDRYFRISNGNTQVNATELRSIPLPPLELLIALGRELRGKLNLPMDIDQIVERFVGVPDQLCLSKAG